MSDSGTIIVPDNVLSNLNPVRTFLDVSYIKLNNDYDNKFVNAYLNHRDTMENTSYKIDQKLVIDG